MAASVTLSDGSKAHFSFIPNSEGRKYSGWTTINQPFDNREITSFTCAEEQDINMIMDADDEGYEADESEVDESPEEDSEDEDSGTAQVYEVNGAGIAGAKALAGRCLTHEKDEKDEEEKEGKKEEEIMTPSTPKRALRVDSVHGSPSGYEILTMASKTGEVVGSAVQMMTKWFNGF